jgi:hypothetical protein
MAAVIQLEQQVRCGEGQTDEAISFAPQQLEGRRFHAFLNDGSAPIS